MNITAHMLVCNEEKWIKYAILSVLPFVEKIIIFDTGSTDDTIKIIKKNKCEKIIFSEKGKANPARMVELRNQMCSVTETEWFMLCDGDEVYPRHIFKSINHLDITKYDGIYLRNHLCVGDIFHRIPEKFGKYEICGHRGHLNLRFYRKIPDRRWQSIYPLEYYGDDAGHKLQNKCNRPHYLNDYYWHMSFLERSSLAARNHLKYHLGEKINEDLPEVLKNENFPKRTSLFVFRSLVESPIRYLKNLF